MDHQQHLHHQRRRQPAAIDITWISCRGVRSSIPFHTPCLYASISLSSSSKITSGDRRRPHRVKTPTDRAGGENPEWDAPLRLYLPNTSSAEGENNNNDSLLVRFELKAQLAVLGDVLTASAFVPVCDLAADGQSRRVSYQLVASDGKQPNGVISFSYVLLHDSKNDDVVTPSSPVAAAAVISPAPTVTTAGLYPMIDSSLAEPVASIYPPLSTEPATNLHVYPPPPSVTAVEPIAIYPPLLEPASYYPPPEQPLAGCGIYPPPVAVAPPSYYRAPPQHGGCCGYPPAPDWDRRCLYS